MATVLAQVRSSKLRLVPTRFQPSFEKATVLPLAGQVATIGRQQNVAINAGLAQALANLGLQVDVAYRRRVAEVGHEHARRAVGTRFLTAQVGA